ALDEHLFTGAQAAERPDLGAVLVALRQQAQHVAHALNAEPRQLLAQTGADADEARDRPVEKVVVVALQVTVGLLESAGRQSNLRPSCHASERPRVIGVSRRP